MSEEQLTEATSLACESSRNIIFVISMHRSGTSATTRTLNLLGASLPKNILGPNFSNLTGHWESLDILSCHERFLAAIQSGWNDPRPLPQSVLTSDAARRCHDDLVEILNDQFKNGPTIVVKDPRICKIVPLWKEVISSVSAQPTAIIPIRHPIDVAASLEKRDHLRLEHGLALWLIHMLLAEKGSREWPRCFVKYDDLVDKTAATVTSMCSNIGCIPSSNILASMPEIESYWSKSYRHHRTSAKKAVISSAVIRKTYAWLCRAAVNNELKPSRMDALWSVVEDAFDLYGGFISEALEKTTVNQPLSQEGGEKGGDQTETSPDSPSGAEA